jgi:hypothetical protein
VAAILSQALAREYNAAGLPVTDVARGEAEIDCLDVIEDLKIAGGPLLDVLTAKSLHGGLVDAWVMHPARARAVVTCLLARWQRDGLPRYAQFDNDTLFQGAHQHADSVGRVSRLCLALGVTPLFAPPLEHGLQNTIESFNALWQAKVWQRHHVRSAAQLQMRSDCYVAAHRARHIERAAPPRRAMPRGFVFDLQAPLRGQMIFIRRTDGRGQVTLLGHTWHISAHWTHRLLRCEVDFEHHLIRCFALRRREPNEQHLLRSIPYRFPNKPFKDKP